jgi:hypothetical protein
VAGRRRRGGDAGCPGRGRAPAAGNLPKGDTGEPQPTKSRRRTDATPVASGLAMTGRVALPGPAAAVAVAVGEDAVWVLLEQGTLLRVDPDRHRVTGRLELEAPPGGMPAGPLAVGAGGVGGDRGARTPARGRLIALGRIVRSAPLPEGSRGGRDRAVGALTGIWQPAS